MRSRTIRVLAAAAGLVLASVSGAVAQSFPSRTIRLIVPFPPGGSSDVLARILADKVSEKLHQKMIIDNRAGGGTIIGAEAAVNADPDGYTVFWLTAPTAINATLVKKLPYDTLRDFVPVATIAKIPLVVLVPKDHPSKTIQELAAESKKKSGGYSYGSSGNGGSPHLTMELIRKETGMALTHIPFKGSAPAVSALIGGHVDLVTDTVFLGHQQMASGKIRALATTGAERSSLMPDVPTLREQGLTNFESTSWFALSVPKGTPRERIDTLNKTVVDILRAPDFVERLRSQGFEVVGDTPEAAAAFFKAEIAKWGEAVKVSGAEVD